MAPIDVKDTILMLLKRSELNDLLDYTNAAIQANKQSRFPQVLWTSSNIANGFTAPDYGRGWRPNPTVPPSLNAVEALEYTAAYTSKYHYPDTLDSRLISSRGASNSTIRELFPSP